MVDETESGETAVDFESKAREMGWSPKEQFRGDPERWMDAETFVKRGEEFIPFLKATTKRQQAELDSQRGELVKLQNIVKANQETIDALKEFNSAANLKAAEAQKAKLVTELREARESGDVEREESLREQLGETTAAIKASKETKPVDKPKDPEPVKDWTQSPEWKEWHSENEWFGKDRRRSAMAIAIGAEIRDTPEGKELSMRKFLDKVGEETEKVLPSNTRRAAPPKVAGGSRGNGEGDGGSPRNHSYGDLPSDAKKACEEMAPRLVGENRAYKTIADWRKAYVERYDWS